jgi:PAS domain-containing protein
MRSESILHEIETEIRGNLGLLCKNLETDSAAIIKFNTDSDEIIQESPSNVFHFTEILNISTKLPRVYEKLQLLYPYFEPMDSYNKDIRDRLIKIGVNLLLFAPISINGKLWGCVCCVKSDNKKEFQLDDLTELVESVNRLSKYIYIKDRLSNNILSRIPAGMGRYAADGYLIFNTSGAIEDAGGNILSDLDVPKTVWLEKNILDLIHPNDRPSVERILLSGNNWPISDEIRIISGEGNWVWYKLFFYHADTDGESLKNLCLAVNISRTKELLISSQKLIESYESLLDILKVAILALDNDARIMIALKNSASIISYSPDELTGKPLGYFIHPEDRENIIKLALNPFRQTPWGNFRFKLKSGDYANFSIEFRSLLVNDGAIRTVCIMEPYEFNRKESFHHDPRFFMDFFSESQEKVIIWDMDCDIINASRGAESLIWQDDEKKRLISPDNVDIIDKYNLKSEFIWLQDNYEKNIDLDILLPTKQILKATAHMKHFTHGAMTSAIAMTINEKKTGLPVYLIKKISENISDLVWVTDMEFKYTYINPSIEWLLGYKPEKAMKMFGDNITTTESLAKIADALSEGLIAAQKRDLQWMKIFPVDMVSSSGEKIRGDIKVMLFCDEFENCIGFIGITHFNITIKNIGVK